MVATDNKQPQRLLINISPIGKDNHGFGKSIIIGLR